MKAAKFLENKIKRQLKCNGMLYDFLKVKEDKYHQLVESGEKVQLTGLYHESVSYQPVSSSDAARLVKKVQPMILCLLEDTKEIKTGCKLSIGERHYKVSAIEDIQNYHVACNISLEEVL